MQLSCGAAAKLAIVLAGCLLSAPARPQTSSMSQAIVPLIDYHTHLNSLMYAQANLPPLLPEIQLPDELKTVIVAAGEAANSEEALTPLYTADSVMVRSDVHNWIRGRADVVKFWSTTFAGPYKLVPVSYAGDDNVGYVSAYFGRNVDGVFTYRGQILFALRKEDGHWRIAAQTVNVPGPDLQKAVPPEQLIAELDAAGIKRANVLSPAFVFGSKIGTASGEYEKVRAENDWVAGAAAKYPTRIVAFCGFNPLKDYALRETERCARNPNIKGLKFHFSDSGVDLKNPQHLAQLQEVFRAANRYRLAITAHVGTEERAYDGRATALILLNELLPLVPDVPVQLAHMSGDTGWTPQTKASFDILASAILSHDARTRNLYFDAAGVVLDGQGQTAEDLEAIADSMRRVGFDRILFGSDRHGTHNPSPATAWELWRTKLALSDEGFRDIADNVVLYPR